LDKVTALLKGEETQGDAESSTESEQEKSEESEKPAE
jgi:hypothetical protein